MDSNQMREWTGELLVSTKKIWRNFKKFWWVGAGVMAIAIALVAGMTFLDYRADKVAATLETYQGEALVYIDSGDEDYSDAYNALLYSERVREQVNQALLANGFEEFDKNLDTANVDMKGTSMCYRVIVRSIGFERTQFIANQFVDILMNEVTNVMGLRGKVIDRPVMTSYVGKKSGVEIFELDEPKQVTLSLRSFLSWSKLMILCAGIFIWFAVVIIFVFRDRTIRTKEEMEQVAPVPCLCEVKEDDEESAQLLSVILYHMAKRGEGDKFLLASAGENGKLGLLVEKVQALLKEKDSAAVISTASHMAFSAEALEASKQADYVLLYADLDRDQADTVDRAFIHMDTVGANLAGYVLNI